MTRSGIAPYGDSRFVNTTSGIASSASGYPLPIWLRLVRSSETFIASESADGTSWTLPPPLSAWTDLDIGNVGVAGGFVISGSTLSVSGSGADIWDSADAFHFASQPLHGDGTIVAQVTSLDNTNGFAKAGVMVRQSLATDSPNAFVFLTPGQGAAFQTRAASGGATTFNAGPWWVAAPYWVKLMRSGNTFSAYISPDGTTWTLVTTQTVAMTADVYVGLAVTSHNNSVIAAGVFTNVTVTGSGAPPPPSQVAAPAFSPGGGTYVSAQNVSITSATSGVSIRYTADGSAPTSTTGTLYFGPVYIGSTATLMAVAYESGLADSTVTSGIYTIGSPPPPPPTWADSDIGNVGVPGGFALSGGTLSVSGSGADIWDGVDAFHFTYQPWHGDGEIISQVEVGNSVGSTDTFGKMGVMFRQSLAADSPNAFAFLTYAAGAAFQTRAASGGVTNFDTGPWWVRVTYWVKLVRSGNTFSAYTSPDGMTWTLITTQTIAMTADVDVGFAVTSHNNSAILTGNFTNFIVDIP